MRLTFLLFILGICFSCRQAPVETAAQTEKSWPEGIAYEIFVQSFYDSDGDSIGDIPGMAQKLDYLKELDIDAIWLMPIMPSPSYHKYDVVDYYGIHPDYGTMEDFKDFLNKAHQRDIKVIIDLVVNHTGNQHPWFLNAASGKESEYRDYYVWAKKDSVAEQIAKKEISFDSDNITQWHPVDGDTTAEHYYGFFWGGMPDLNFDNPKVREEIYDIGRFWLEEVGVDGFRLDAAKHIFPDDRAADNHAFWKEFKEEMEAVNPDVYLVGEIWANAETTAPYAAGFSSFFNFDLAFSILESVNRGEVLNSFISGHGWQINQDSSFISRLIRNREKYSGINNEYTDAIFLSNHDQNRVMSVLQNDESKAKVAAAILLTLPGTPYIYYGEEIGMRGEKPDPRIREPFLWKGDNSKGRPLWLAPKYNTSENVRPLSVQQKDPNSLFNHYKNLIEIRKKHKALTFGELEEAPIGEPGVLAFKRVTGSETILVLHNLSGTDKILQLPEAYAELNPAEQINGIIEKSDSQLKLPAYSSTILKE